MPVESLFAKLEPLLPTVQKPIQYVGGELNSTLKDWDDAEVRWALMYPDAYEVGLPNQGVQILYEILNERDWILAERTYAVFSDMEQVMRDNAIPQFTVDGHRPVGAFDVLGTLVRDRARLHQHAHRARPGRHPAARRRPHRRPPDRAGRRPLGVQPRADRRLHRRRRARRRRGDRARDQRGHPRVEAAGPPGWPRRAAVPARCLRRRLRAQVLRRRVPARRPDQAGRPQPLRRPVAGAQAHPDGPRPVAVPEQAAGAARRDRARALLGRDLPRLHARLPLLPGRHDHPAGARALDHHDRRHGRQRHQEVRLRGGRPAVAVVGRPQRDRRGRQGTRRSLRGQQRLAVAAVHPRRRVQHHAGQRVLPQRPPVRPDVRARGRVGAAAQGDQQDGVRGRPDPHRRRGVLARLAPGEALLHVRPARPRPTRTSSRSPTSPRRSSRPAARSPDVATSVARCRSAASCPSRTRRSSGRRSSTTRPPTCGCRSCATRSGTTSSTAGRSASATTTASRARSRDCSRAATAGSARSSSRSGATAAGSTAGASTSPTTAGSPACEAALAGTPVDLDWYTTREREYSEVLPWDHLDSGLDRDWLWEDWQDAVNEVEVEDCRWTPCFDCGVCPEMGTEIQVGPTGQQLLPLSVVVLRIGGRDRCDGRMHQSGERRCSAADCASMASVTYA